MIVLIHGGAALVNIKLRDTKLDGLKHAVKRGYEVLLSGNTAVDAVEAAVNSMEDNPAFNAGYGSSLTITGEVEMDAIIMDGRTLKSGAVGGVSRVKNPVSLAKAIMERSDHCLLICSGAELFAHEVGIPLIDRGSLVHEWARERLNEYKTFVNSIQADKMPAKDHDTVGAVAIDCNGNVAAATSTGGITGKRVGRVGDSPVIGAGGWADNTTGAVSTTGHGEAIMRVCLSREVMYQFNPQQNTLQEATDAALELMRHRIDGYGGAISISHDRQIGISFTTAMMPWAYIDSNDPKPLIHYGVTKGQHFTCDF